MLIDWFTVGAQLLNFLILVWLLKHFLYKPILNAIDAREERIAAQLADTEAKAAKARREGDDLKAKNKAFDEQRVALMAKVTEEAAVERKRLVEEMHKEADSLRTAADGALQEAQKSLSGEIARLAAGEVFDIARKALGDLANASLEGQMTQVFVRRLAQTTGKAKDTLSGALKSASEPALVRSTFDLPTSDRDAIQKALNETFSADIRLQFESGGEGVCGIELTAGGQRLAWSIADYLHSLEQAFGKLVDGQSPTAVKPEQKPAPVSSLPPIIIAHAGAQ